MNEEESVFITRKVSFHKENETFWVFFRINFIDKKTKRSTTQRKQRPFGLVQKELKVKEVNVFPKTSKIKIR